MKENVFIGWGGNSHLANMVKFALDKQHNYLGIVGGAHSNYKDKAISLYQTIINQMNDCTHAIFLIEKIGMTEKIISHNLMFEFGYLVSKIGKDHVHCFLIDTKEADRHPFYIEGYQYNQIDTDRQKVLENIDKRDVEIDKIVDKIVNIVEHDLKKDKEYETVCKNFKKATVQAAEMIVRKFVRISPKEFEMDKIEILANWHNSKIILRNYASGRDDSSPIKIANILIHSMEACYYHEELDKLSDICQSITENKKDTSEELKAAINIVQANSKLFMEYSGLTEPIKSVVALEDLKMLFDINFDGFKSNENLFLYLKYFHNDRLALLHLLYSNGETDAAPKKYNLDSAKRYAEEALRILKVIARKYPKEEEYILLYEGYVHRDLYKIYKELNMSDAKNSINAALSAIKNFKRTYSHYKSYDTYLLNSFDAEYCLRLQESRPYIKENIKNDTEKKITELIEKMTKNRVPHIVINQALNYQVNYKYRNSDYELNEDTVESDITDFKKEIINSSVDKKNGILRVDDFLNQKVKKNIITNLVNKFTEIFREHRPTIVLTIEASGIPIAALCAKELDAELVYAKKSKHEAHIDNCYQAKIFCISARKPINAYVLKTCLRATDRVLIIDDILASGETVNGLISIIEQANAKLVGVGVCIQKLDSETNKHKFKNLHSLAKIKTNKKC